MASTSIPLLGKLRQLLSAVYPMHNERAASVVAPMIAQPTAGTSSIESQPHGAHWLGDRRANIRTAIVHSQQKWVPALQVKFPISGGKLSASTSYEITPLTLRSLLPHHLFSPRLTGLHGAFWLGNHAASEQRDPLS